MLTIGLATFDDYDGVYFSLQAIRMYHAEVMDEVEFLVLDNNSTSKEGIATAKYVKSLPNARYFPFDLFSGTSSRDFIFRKARTDFVLCMDSHVFFTPGSLRKLLDYFKANSNTSMLLQGPLIYDDLVHLSTHFHPKWQQGMFGTWDTDDRAKDPSADPFEIPMQGLGIFAARKAAWLGFNSRFRGFGGEEGYIHEKYRLAGFGTLCLPFLRWMHRFNRPHGTQYLNLWEDRIRNYIIGHFELQMDIEPLRAHFQELLGAESYQKIEADIFRELSNPSLFFDAILWDSKDLSDKDKKLMEERFDELGIKHLVLDTSNSFFRGASLREFKKDAKAFGYQTFLLIKGRVRFETDFFSGMREKINNIINSDWQELVVNHCHSEGTEVQNAVVGYRLA